VSTAVVQTDVIEDKVYALLFASWQDGSYWVGEVHENASLGIYVLCSAGRGGSVNPAINGPRTTVRPRWLEQSTS